MILQIHEESIEKGPIDLAERTMAQAEFPDNIPLNGFDGLIGVWLRTVQNQHTLQSGCHWVIHFRDSPNFVLARAKETATT